MNTDTVLITAKAHHLLTILVKENPFLRQILVESQTLNEALIQLKTNVVAILKEHTPAYQFYIHEKNGRTLFEQLQWKDYASIRILDSIDNADRQFDDPNLRGEKITTNPVKLIWLAFKEGRGGATPDFFEDMIHLFRQFSGKLKQKKTSPTTIKKYMNRFYSGLDRKIIRVQQQNRDRIISVLIGKIQTGELKSQRFQFSTEKTFEEKYQTMLRWWEKSEFHLTFAIRNPDLLNEMLDKSLNIKTMNLLRKAYESGIPFFINPYYLSFLDTKLQEYSISSDLAIREYLIYSKQLVKEFGHIVAWEKEDIVEEGKPNAAGWLLPAGKNVHRRYPEVAILIPDTVGRACAGLCASCQRMYDFQKGHLNFDLEKLKPKQDWNTKLTSLLDYFENDSQLRDILITGGDALMSSDKSLKEILDGVYEMAIRKRNANLQRAENDKYAEIVRIRLGTRLLAYLPQRITPELINILTKFKQKASIVGIKQFVIQAHFESPLEITPTTQKAIKMLLSAGWIVTNQLVFSVAASRKGHTAKLRKVLNDCGIVTYYTFIVKGYRENSRMFAPVSRAVQEQLEEKVLGKIDEKQYETLLNFSQNPKTLAQNLRKFRKTFALPFLATDRNVLNLPGVGKSLSFRTIGITYDGRRILEFDHDSTRFHSPIINQMGKVVIIESKPIREYLRQLENAGENVAEYENVYGYSLGETEPQIPIYQYPKYDFKVTKTITNLEL